ncbi:ribose 5-phosphate isomerase B [Peptococcus simiae]|uniref:Ribose 5-phosphate isomerase B n=1 Tax=Peptococcus simiae TaxID=1643805 RepID=A0ABW9H0L2_9FIRM
MKIAVGSDHGGLDLKTAIVNHLEAQGHEVIDYGTDSSDSCDYPLIALPLAKDVAAGKLPLGILICGTGIGIGIAANKVPGVRAALCHDTFSAHAAREHNNANILTLGQRVIGQGLALEIVDRFLSATFEGGRHERRVDEIAAIERGEL